MLAAFPEKILSVDCLIIDTVYSLTESPMRLFYMRVILFALLPFGIICASFFFWQVNGCISALSKEERNDKNYTTIIIILFLFYPAIVSYMAESVNCYSLEGEFRLYNDLEEVCYIGTHLVILVLVSVPGLLVWALGIPFFALQQLLSFSKLRDSYKAYSNPSHYNSMSDRFELKFGFLTSGYQEKFYFWEVLLILRKTLIVLMITLLAPLSKGMQSLTTISVLLAFLTVHIKIAPFNDQRLNDLESYSLIVLIITIYFGLYYQSSKGTESLFESDITKWLVFFGVFVTSSTFLAHFIYKMHAEIV